ncbi:MAG TPA: hypothetical protein VHG35_12040 [Gemmatimonadales bacterium]|nr:hypothetical protein [Gemmatimonadales bacterium]
MKLQWIGRRSRALGLLLFAAAFGCREDGAAPTSPESEAAPATAAVAGALPFRHVSAGESHTCGVTPGDKAYCWGNNGAGRLGDGTTTARSRPVPVAGGLSFQQVSAGVNHSCGVTTDQRAYCWGVNHDGQLGNGTTTTSLTPVPVAGTRRFRQISAGDHHTCAVTPANVAFCWGSSLYGVLGTGGGSTLTPVRVAGGLEFRQVSAGFSHTCGATTDERGYCWGNNSNYQLGNGTAGDGSSTPVAVAGGHKFRQVFAGSGYISPSSSDVAPDHALTCGVTTADHAYCWGSGAGSADPVRIGDRRFPRISAGTQGCGVTGAGGLYCWSLLGLVHVPSGGRRFESVSVSGVGGHTCVVGTNDRAYCWGDNSDGQLGDGTTTSRTKPTAVAGPI